MESIQQIKFILATILGLVVSLIGEGSALLDFLLLLIVSDFILGMIKAVKKKKFRSSIVRWGAVNKTVEILIIVILNFCDRAFNFDIFRNAGIVWFCICESSSILENLIILGLPVPSGLKDVFAKVKVGVAINFVTIIEESLKRMIKEDEEKHDKQQKR